MSSTTQTSEKNRLLFRRELTRQRSVELERPEQLLLERFRERWLETSMLDLGVGNGRTTYTFAPLAGRYVAIDYSPEVLPQAREVLPGADHVEILEGDARRLQELFDESFDLILFSFNGIDSVDHRERLDVLRQIRALLVEDGLFCFSAHSAHSLPLEEPPWGLELRNPLRSVYRAARAWQERRRVRRVNAGLDLDTLLDRGWDRIADGSHGFQERWYYVTVAEQLRQLEGAGFGRVEVLANDGSVVDPGSPGRDPWFHYMCQAG